MDSLVPFLIWLLCIGISAIILGFFIKNGLGSILENEGFNSTISMSTCPASSLPFITADGNTNCCDGDIVNKQCNGSVICSLSPGVKGIRACPDWINGEWNTRNAKFCTPSIPYYFGTINRTPGSIEGCSASPPIQDGTAPRDPTQPMCKIYNSLDDEYGKADSCFNIKAKEQMVCPIPSATKNIIPSMGPNGKPAPALLNCTYMPPNGASITPVQCYDNARAKIYLDTFDPTGKLATRYMPTADKNLIFCTGSRNYYVDGTIAKKDLIAL
jgi:hypothetical protein